MPRNGAAAAVCTPSASTASFSSTHSNVQLTPSDQSDDAAAVAEQSEGVGRRMELTPQITSTSTFSRRTNGTEDEEAELLENQRDGVDRDGSGIGRWRRRRRMDRDDERFALYSPEEEKEVLRRLDIRLVGFMALLYMLSFLDRSNIGNARIAGLEKDLNLTSSQYEWLLTAFYITYILFEWMTLLYRLIPAHIYISLCVLSWGVVASLQALVPSYHYLLALRALLGIGEAAFGPGLPFYLSFFFRRNELAYRTGLFISAAPLAMSFASSLAWLITKMGERSPIAPWRLLFLVEGFPSVFVAAIAWRIVPDSPETAKFLTKRERKVAKLRMQDEREAEAEEEEDVLSREDAVGKSSKKKKKLVFRVIARTLMDPKSYMTALMFFNCNVAFSSMPVFLPTIINDMGHSAVTSQLLSAFPSLVAFPILLVIARMSDRSASRSPYLMFTSLLGFLGYSTLALSSPSLFALPSWIRYMAIFPATAGFFSSITLIISWNLNNQVSSTGKGTGLALLNVIGQCGPLVGTRLYPKSHGPYYTTGMTVCAGCMIAVATLAFCLRWSLIRQNAKRKNASYDDDETDEFLFIL